MNERDDSAVLRRCIRDLVALQAVPSMCVGRSLADTLTIVTDAVNRALDCDVLYLRAPGTPTCEQAVIDGRRADAAEARAIGLVADCVAAEPVHTHVPGAGSVVAIAANVHGSGGDGRLLVGRWRETRDDETLIVLVRVAANLISATLETARVLDSARRKDDLIAHLSHELRNPLAPIMTAVELLAREPSVARERTIIGRHAQHLMTLLDGLMDLARTAANDLDLRRERIELSAVVDQALEIAGPLIARNGHQLALDVPAGLFVEGDAIRLAQVFGNLLSNAAKFTPNGGHIEVRALKRDTRVAVRVTDDGRGIERDHRERIFEPFVRVGVDVGPVTGSLGLGLAIVKNIVTRHGGTIGVESDGLGAGAAFTVELELCDPPERGAPNVAGPSATARASTRVLIVDDNVDAAELLAEALAHEGFKTVVAHDAESALAIAREVVPQAAILDLALPKMDGYELAEKLRAEHREIKLIAATGYGEDRDRDRVRAAGFVRHFVKPVHTVELVSALETH